VIQCQTILTGRWCHIIVLNVHAPTEDKIDDVKDSWITLRRDRMGVVCTGLVWQDGDKWGALVNPEMNLRVT
jgi:hypothetical protein